MPRYPPPVIRLSALILVLAHAAATAAPCTIHGTDVKIEHVLVRPADGEAFTIGLAHAEVTATPTRAATQLAIAGSIRFEATAKQKLWYSVIKEITTPDGLVTLSHGAHLIGTGVDGGSVRGSAVMYSNDVMEGEDKSADELVENVAVACDQLSLDWFSDAEYFGKVEPPGDAANAAVAELAKPYYVKNGKARLVLRSEPKPNAKTVTYSYPNCSSKECFVVYEEETKGAWMRVSSSNEGVVASGWVPSAQLERAPDDIGFGHSYGCSGRSPRRQHGDADRVSTGAQRKARSGRGDLRSPKRGAWATVTQELEIHASWKDGDTWAEVTALPGITDLDGHAYVPITSLKVI